MVMDKLFHPTLFNGCDYLSMLVLKLKLCQKKGSQEVEHEWNDLTLCDMNKIATILQKKFENAFISRKSEFDSNCNDSIDIDCHRELVREQARYKLQNIWVNTAKLS